MMKKQKMTSELEEARQEYEELFKEKPSKDTSAEEIRDTIREANEQFEKEFY